MIIKTCVSNLKLAHERTTLNFIHQIRNKTAWIRNTGNNQTSPSTSDENIDVEEIFLKREVQDLLKKVRGLDMDKVYSYRLKKKEVGRREQRMHYALMTDEKLAQVKEKYTKMADYYLQLVPIKEPLPEEYTVIAKDPELLGFEEAKYAFYDMGPDSWGNERLCVYRDPDGTLRTAKPEELRRLNRAFYPEHDKPVKEPPVFSEPHLTYALKLNKYELVLDYACWFFEPDDIRFVEVTAKVIDRALSNGKLDLLYGTRHFATVTFYCALNKKIEPYFKFFALKNDTTSMAVVVKLHKIMFPDWRHEINSKDQDDFALVYDFAVQNKYKDPVLVQYLNLDILSSKEDPVEETSIKNARKQARS